MFQNAANGSGDPGGTGNYVNLVLQAHSSGDYTEAIRIGSSRGSYGAQAVIVYST